MYRFNKATLLVAAIAAVALARADVSYDNFGAGDTYQPSWWGIGGSQVTGSASTFLSATTGKLSKVTLALLGNAKYDVSVWSDVNGSLGVQLESWAGVVGNPNDTSAGGYTGTVSMLGDGSVFVQTGTRYFIDVQPHDGAATNGGWNFSPSDYGTVGTSYGGGNWTYNDDFPKAALRVETSPVPEPSSVLILAGLSIAVARRRRLN